MVFAGVHQCVSTQEMINIPKCPDCKKELLRVNEFNIFECTNCGFVIHHLNQIPEEYTPTKCKHTVYKEFHNEFGSLKHCHQCYEYFDVKRTSKVESIDNRIKSLIVTIDRLEAIRFARMENEEQKYATARPRGLYNAK
jgi:ribosomal protein L37AE/L43A